MRNLSNDRLEYILARIGTAITLAIILIILPHHLFAGGQCEQSSGQQDPNGGAKPRVAHVKIRTQKRTYEFSIDGSDLKKAGRTGNEQLAVPAEGIKLNNLFNPPEVTVHLRDSFNLVPLRLFKGWPLELDPGQYQFADFHITTEESTTPVEDEFKAETTYKASIQRSTIYANVELPQRYPVTANPIVLEEDRVPFGGELNYRIASRLVDSNATAAVLVYKCGPAQRDDPVVLPMIINPVPGEDYYLGAATLPRDGRIKRDSDWWRLGQTVDTVAVVRGEDDYAVLTSTVEFTRSSSAAICAFLLVVIIVLLASWLAGTHSSTPSVRWQQKALDFVGLRFAVTAYGRYSVSLLQAMFWTLVTLWGLIFVWLIRWELLSITGQALILLGIGGGTAIMTRSIDGSREVSIPETLTPNLNRTKVPQFNELITIQGQPSLFKFQILATTAIVGMIVVREIFMLGSFPEIGENLLLLMGISGGSYVLNEATETDSQRLTALADELKKMDDGTRNQPGNKAKKDELEELLVKLRGWTRKG